MKTYEDVQEFLKELLEIFGFPNITVEEADSSEGEFFEKVFILHVSEEDSGFLIGQFGNTLRALQHVVRMLIAKKFPEYAQQNFRIDVNDYRKKRDQNVVELARSVAREVFREKKEKLLRPMSAYERRLVHMELSKERNVITRSVGEGDDRRIIVEPIVEEQSF